MITLTSGQFGGMGLKKLCAAKKMGITVVPGFTGPLSGAPVFLSANLGRNE